MSLVVIPFFSGVQKDIAKGGFNHGKPGIGVRSPLDFNQGMGEIA